MANPKSRLRNQADKLWKQIILELHPQCECCGYESHDPHHFFPKGLYGALRFDIENGIGLCVSCHFARHHQGDPTIHQKIIEVRGGKWYNKLKEKSKETRMSFQTIGYYRQTIESLKGALENNS